MWFSGRRSRQSALHSKLQSKTDAVATGPVVLDPDDGVNRTPKGLLHSGSLKIPIKQLAGLISDKEDSAHFSASAEAVVDALPSLNSVPMRGSTATQSIVVDGIIADGWQARARDNTTVQSVRDTASVDASVQRSPFVFPISSGKPSLKLLLLSRRMFTF